MKQLIFVLMFVSVSLFGGGDLEGDDLGQTIISFASEDGQPFLTIVIGSDGKIVSADKAGDLPQEIQDAMEQHKDMPTEDLLRLLNAEAAELDQGDEDAGPLIVLAKLATQVAKQAEGSDGEEEEDTEDF